MIEPRYYRWLRMAYTKGYHVTDDGKVISHLGNQLSVRPGKRLKYPVIRPSLEGGSRTIYAHDLAAYSFFGEAMFDAECVRHLDGNLTNLSRSNIATGSYSANEMDKPTDTRVAAAKVASKFTKRFVAAPCRTVVGDLRKCKRCKTMRQTSDFGSWRRSADGLAYWCRECRRVYEAQRRKHDRS